MFEEEYVQLGKTIIALRKEKFLSQIALSKKANISRPRLSYIERGKGNFNIEMLFLISKALETTPSCLLQQKAVIITHTL